MTSGSPSPVFTVLTPTFNRADVLHRVYESLCEQSFTDFEWLVIDDGSTDDTSALVEGWAKEAPFPVRYKYQSNQHKKVALNHGTREARGFFLAIADSDDRLLPDALKDLHHAWQEIPDAEKPDFVGVTGMCVDEQGREVGDRHPADPWDVDSVESRFIVGVKGEKWGCQRCDVMRDHPFPEDVAGLVPESLIWDRIALKYKTRYINKHLRIYFESTDSITVGQSAKITSVEADGILLGYITFLEDLGPRLLGKAPKLVAVAAIQYARYAMHQIAGKRRMRWWPKRPLSIVAVIAALPVAFLFWVKDRLKAR